MAARTAWVFAGGVFTDTVFRHATPGKDDYIVSVDHGLRYCLDAGLHPDLLIGDFDSVAADLLQRPDLVNVPRVEFPAVKDSSDLELALLHLSRMNLDKVFVVAVSGGRTDHMLINWQLMSLREWPFLLEYIDDSVSARVLYGTAESCFNVEPGTVVSLVPLKEAGGVSTVGFQYELDGASLFVGSSLGLSNVSLGTSFSVSVQSGVVLALVTNEKQNI